MIKVRGKIGGLQQLLRSPQSIQENKSEIILQTDPAGTNIEDYMKMEQLCENPYFIPKSEKRCANQ